MSQDSAPGETACAPQRCRRKQDDGMLTSALIPALTSAAIFALAFLSSFISRQFRLAPN
ncbi:hypothetical protein [Methylobacterium sp. WL9]|uniref:hypothetical protein n=1 Tax=Methylobacterium sp. WL9 TaxID=2603898 RepID=UPI00164FDFE7|nr:hypothetical protein [Methylobacterium sp. WL9]